MFLKEIFSTYLKSTGITWDGTAGEVLLDGSEDANTLIETIKVLKSNLTKIRDGSEKEWLKSIAISKLKSSKGLIILHDYGTNYDFSSLFASQVSILQQFATLKIVPLKTLITHEMNVSNADITPGDTHLEPDIAKQTLKKISENKKLNLDKIQIDEPEEIDNLYQSESYLELININYVLEELKKLQ